MSYILQALARSERERKQLDTRDLGEALETTPASPQVGRPHPWTIIGLTGGIVTLAIALLIVTIVPDRRLGGSAGATTVAQAPTPAQTSAAQRPPRPSEVPLATTAPVRPATKSIAGAQTATAPLRQVAVSTAEERGRQPPQEPSARPAHDASPVVSDKLERVLSLPGIDMTIHVYSDQPERRFVYVNGQRYKERETIAGTSARVASITRQGLIVDLEDRRVLLQVRE